MESTSNIEENDVTRCRKIDRLSSEQHQEGKVTLPLATELTFVAERCDLRTQNRDCNQDAKKVFTVRIKFESV